MKLDKSMIGGIVLFFVIVIVDFIFFFGEKLFYFLFVAALVLGALPFLIKLLGEQSEQKEKESRFLEFSRDLVEGVKSGTPIVKSILNIQNRDYGSLSPQVKKLANQLSLGIPLHDALVTFAKESNSKVISRAVALISEAERAGGNIGTILESVSTSVGQTEELKKERSSSISNLVVQGYIIFLVFIVIMIVLEFKILPLVSDLGAVDSSSLSVSVKSVDADEFSLPMMVLLLIQSFFAGLVIGKISEGSIMSGVKHSFILLAITLLVKTGASVLFGG